MGIRQENLTDFLLTIIKNEKLDNEYQAILSASLLELPSSIDNFILAFKTKNVALYNFINPYQIFNDLFIQNRINSAIQLTKNTIDLELSNIKIEKIYNNFQKDWVPSSTYANKEVADFYNFLKILNS